ncbi:hypothetical protein ABLE94_00600 [Gordonia sp. VNK1]|uniref:hypothetical protein n=1 Tax=Gordonia oleivorans TaxID=3156618 RepID=UPI0032B4AE74
MSSSYDAIVVNTYRNLRLAMVALIAMLAVAIVMQSWRADFQWQNSISGYYFTSAHGVVIGALCGLGALLVVYKGSTEAEDVILNVSGFLAFLVAFLPAEVPDPLYPPGELNGFPVHDNVFSAGTAAFAAGFLALALYFILWRRQRSSYGKTGRRWANVLRVLGYGVIAVLAGLYIADVWGGREWTSQNHNIAAVSLFIGLGLVVICNAFVKPLPDQEDGHSVAHSKLRHRRRTYALLAGGVLVGVTIVAIALAMHDSGPLLLIGEIVGLAFFAIAWSIQTWELWDIGPREVPPRVAMMVASGPSQQDDQPAK